MLDIGFLMPTVEGLLQLQVVILFWCLNIEQGIYLVESSILTYYLWLNEWWKSKLSGIRFGPLGNAIISTHKWIAIVYVNLAHKHAKETPNNLHKSV